MARAAEVVEQFLEGAGFDRAPWAVVAFGAGVAFWFVLANQAEWLGLICTGLAAAFLAWALWPKNGRFPQLRQAVIGVGLMLAAGCACVWGKAVLVGAPPIAHQIAGVMVGTVLDRYDQPALARARLEIATREPRTGRLIRVRLTLPLAADAPGVVEGAVIAFHARLMPPSPMRFPGTYDFAEAAWFDGVSATGSVLGKVVLARPALAPDWLARTQHALAEHVRAQLAGSPGAIAAAFASGDRGGITPQDDQAMRDAGLTHLLSVSGLHVSAVVGGVYVLTLRLLALWPWAALRWRLPLVASSMGGIAGIVYTLLTGAQVPTVRSCLGALLVLAAVALGRQPLSVRMLAVAALVVMVLWPDAVVGPSFQMSFGSVLAIIAVADSAPARAFLAPREEGWWWRIGRHLFMILLTGMVIDLALMPVALYHFHRAGIYGSMANVLAIPLTTFISMPMIGLALALDLAGLGAPAWWVCGKSLEALLAIAHFTAARPDAVSVGPAMGGGAFALFVGAMLWLALWHGRVRLLGLAPALLAVGWLALVRPPDVLIAGDGTNLAISEPDNGRLLLLRPGKSDFTRATMLEAAGISGDVAPLESWPGARCNPDACLVQLSRGGRIWRLLVLRKEAMRMAPAALARACAAVDIVVARGKIFGPCAPGLIRADHVLLLRTGGLALDLVNRRVASVGESEGDHPWWRAPHIAPRDQRPGADTADPAQ
ncbi:MAG TPA: ComEC/Rec2 family competence protein [Novosphingobium sp.]|nr:ComEC/Rec2 family competence protein [Novosphingobium sp.]